MHWKVDTTAAGEGVVRTKSRAGDSSVGQHPPCLPRALGSCPRITHARKNRLLTQLLGNLQKEERKWGQGKDGLHFYTWLGPERLSERQGG